MPVETRRRQTLMGLEARDPEPYARYRSAMHPLLEAQGGRFEHDFEVARVLASSAGACRRLTAGPQAARHRSRSRMSPHDRRRRPRRTA
jgi:hypothetical protein